MDETTKKEILGSLIKREREKQNYTQDKLSSLINIDPRNLSQIENGKSFPSLATFCNIVQVLKIEPNYLLNFIKFDKNQEEDINIELFENIKALPKDTKQKIIELLKIINK